MPSAIRSRPMRHWACFTCRKQFRTPIRGTAKERVQPGERRPCPECGGALIDMGLHFRPPRRHNRCEWEQLRLLAAHGVRFNWGTSAPLFRFLRRGIVGRRYARAMMAQCSCHAATPGLRLLRDIEQRCPRRK